MHKSGPVDEKKIQSTLRKLGANPIPGIEEVREYLLIVAYFDRQISSKAMGRLSTL